MHRTIVLLIVAIAGLALVACASSAQDELLPSTPASNSSAAAAIADRPPAKVGGFVGNAIPEFDMTLLDGSTVSSESLATAARPTYLFFFATW